MAENVDYQVIAASLFQEVKHSSKGVKRLKLKTLLAKFGYSKRSDNNTAQITNVLSEHGLRMNPPIMRLGDSWEITTEDWIYLSCPNAIAHETSVGAATLPSSWNADGWFDRIAKLELRTEKEVEIKFVVPLLARLGYTEDDRYDGMPIPAAHGSRGTTLVLDFALFNNDLESLKNQPLLTVEAKREDLLTKQKQLESAHNQAKSYCLWTQCDYFLVTDSRTIQAYRVGRGKFGELSPVFSCDRQELAERFAHLYSILSKEQLTSHYLSKLSSTEEVS
jgi:hypothetical protein